MIDFVITYQIICTLVNTLIFIFQSLVKLKDPEKVSCPQCAPVKMKSLSMLMYEGEEVIFKNHEDMIVEDCGCR